MEQQKIVPQSIDCKYYGKNQIEKSYNEIETLRREHFDKITKIYKTTEYLENQRNIRNEEAHEERLKELTKFDEELPDSLENLTTEMKRLMDIEQADLLQQQFDEFKAKCQDIMAKKVKLIKEFKNELDFRDQTYVDSMKKFKIDIEQMINLMREQFRDLRAKMLEHLIEIEKQFLRDREDIIDNQYKRHIKYLIDSLDDISTKKSTYLTQLQDKLENEAKEASENLENEYVNKIILLEAHLNTIKERVEEYLYDIKILYEKLEYRLKIREEKIKEAEEKKDQFSSWESKLNDKINSCKELYNKNDLQKRQRNAQLKGELYKMTESFDKLKEKFQHFEKHDELLFKEIFDMKRRQAKDLALKVVLADKTIKTQQLGIEKIPHDDNKGFSYEELQRDEEVEESETAQNSNNKNKANNLKQEILDDISIPRVRQVFYYIIEEAEFLIETEIINKCEGKTLDEKLPEYLKSICDALNIKNGHELKQLLELFLKNSQDAEGDQNDEDNKNDDRKNENDKEEDKGNNNDNNESNNNNDNDKNNQNDEIKIDPDKVLDILKDFYNEKKKKAKENLRNGISSGDIGLEDNEEAKKERQKYYSESYWEKLGNTISEKTHNVWKALDVALTKYHQLLFERKELVGQVDDLNEKQAELQKLLTNYKNSDINKELYVKPEGMEMDYQGGMPY